MTSELGTDIRTERGLETDFKIQRQLSNPEVFSFFSLSLPIHPKAQNQHDNSFFCLVFGFFVFLQSCGKTKKITFRVENKWIDLGIGS